MTEDVFEDLVNLYLDKEITSAQLSILREELERNPHRKRVFEGYCRMHQATHFAALSQYPVIPTLGKSMARSPHYLSHFVSKPAWVGAVLILVVASAFTVYLKSPTPPMAETSESSVEQIDRFYARTETTPQSSTFEVFDTLRTQDQPPRNWAYIQELRHLRATPESFSSNKPEDYSFLFDSDGLLAEQEPANGFDFEYSSYEFKR